MVKLARRDGERQVQGVIFSLPTELSTGSVDNRG
jgi:hypothetical protein